MMFWAFLTRFPGFFFLLKVLLMPGNKRGQKKKKKKSELTTFRNLLQHDMTFCYPPPPLFSHTLEIDDGMTARGVLSGKVGTGMCGPDRVLFRPLRFSNGPFFYLKIGLDIGRIFAKCKILMNFSFGLPIGCQKVLMCPNLHSKKCCLV